MKRKKVLGGDYFFKLFKGTNLKKEFGKPGVKTSFALDLIFFAKKNFF